jgi:putative ubiquitin-RnfH superfamily antitoxin RatB of RatAB toxin-antitoxin module
MASAADLHVEVVYAAPARQAVKSLQLPAGSRVREAIAASGLLAEFPEIDLAVNRVGVYAEPVELDTPLQDGDRVEIYRPLLADPKEARRRRVARGRRR